MPDSLDRMLSALNPEQREAVLEHSRPLLVLAGAGSGKTRVITTKIAYFIEALGCPPYNILAVTFTNKAALEMRERLSTMTEGSHEVSIRTFHAFGAWLLRRYSAQAGVSENFTIYDDEDMVTVLHSIYPDHKRKELKPIAKAISRAKDYCLTPDDDLSGVSYDPRLKEMYTRYERKMRQIGNVDFGDLISRSVELLQADEQIRRRISSRFKVILVDEYQDSNAAQFKLLQQLYDGKNFLCVVGDDDQSIYRFRGAELQNILSFPDHFPGTRIITLEENYRSTKTILDIATKVVGHNTGRHKKILRTSNEVGSKAQLVYVEDQAAEALYCAQLVSKDHRYDDTAILYRTNAQSAAFETIFMRYKIPYKVIGALKFYDREEIKDALAMLSLCLNPSDEVSFRRIINKPSRGIGASSLSVILEQAPQHGGDLIEAAGSALSSMKGKASKGLASFLESYRILVESIAATSLSAALKQALSDFGFIDYYTDQDRIASTQKLNNLDELVSTVSLYPDGIEGLRSFLETLELDPSTVGRLDPLTQSGVTLITMHNTKGLEFERVIISGMEEGLFPGRACESDDDLEEERRIFYVSITRAKRELYLTCCRRRSIWGQSNWQMPSRFLDELPEEQLEITGTSPSGYGLAGGGRKDVHEQHTTAPGREPLGMQYGRQWPKEPSSFATSLTQDAKSEAPVDSLYTPGDAVFHDKYGQGVITASRIEQGREVVDVQFFNSGKMMFIAKYAPLEKIAKDW